MTINNSAVSFSYAVNTVISNSRASENFEYSFSDLYLFEFDKQNTITYTIN